MTGNLLGNLVRQKGALEYLELLLEEEFSHLRERHPDEVSRTEMMIHELVRQVADERLALKESMNGVRLLDYCDSLDDEVARPVIELLQRIDDLEQVCSRAASRNAELALALMDQSQKMLEFMHERIQPETRTTYGGRGRYTTHRPQAALLSGRL
ncbi:flagellar export chaperone FlgN [Oleidesulfovibrio sp.]|uniref:flagellar export chaperone FlgN n=1 Tax=Oleidesulfovibrio sp. TaxID=2909707 RepID=UPI003A881F0A